GMASTPSDEPANARGRGAVGSRHREPGSEARFGRGTRLAAGALAIATMGLGVVQGDGILVEGGRGGRLVVDGGPDPSRLLLALDERLPPWDRRIDVLVLTHPHE